MVSFFITSRRCLIALLHQCSFVAYSTPMFNLPILLPGSSRKASLLDKALGTDGLRVQPLPRLQSESPDLHAVLCHLSPKNICIVCDRTVVRTGDKELLITQGA